MARRRFKPQSVVYDRPWSPRDLELFDLVDPAWSPPKTVRLRKTMRRINVTALFTRPDGQTMTATARLKTYNGRDWFAEEECALILKAPAHG